MKGLKSKMKWVRNAMSDIKNDFAEGNLVVFMRINLSCDFSSFRQE
jgi:hypothetical protein